MSHFPHYELDKNHIHIQPQIMGDPIFTILRSINIPFSQLLVNLCSSIFFMFLKVKSIVQVLKQFDAQG